MDKTKQLSGPSPKPSPRGRGFIDYGRLGLIVVLACVSILRPGSAGAGPPPPQRQTELINLLQQDCGSCHGMTLKGGLGPALTAQALADKPVMLLQNTILNGREGTPMPPWRGIISTEEAGWLIERLREGDIRSAGHE